MIRDPHDGSCGHLTPSTLRKGGERAYALTSRRAHPDRLERAQARGLDAWLHLLDKHQMQANAETCAWHRRGRQKQTPRTLATHCGKTLLECMHSTKASVATPAGALACPHGTAQRPGGKKIPSTSTNLCRFLTDTTAKARGLLSETAIRVP
jgi:hypothetical protein